MHKITTIIISFFLYISILNMAIYAQEINSSPNYNQSNDSANTLVEKMNSYTDEKEAKWSFNPFRRTEDERRMIGWQNPNANITRFWAGTLINASDIYTNENFFLDDISIYTMPTLASEFSLVAFEVSKFKFYIGVGFLLDFNMPIYGEHVPRYGYSLILSDHMKFEGYIDMLIDDVWKIRFIPLRHRCDHIGGEWYGDPSLFDQDTGEFCETGYDNMGIDLFHIFGWFTFYGGMEWNMNWLIPATPSTFRTLFDAHIGTDIRFPIWGKLSVIAGFYVAATYREYKDLYKAVDPDTLLSDEATIIGEPYTKWQPTISLGLGLEIDRYSIGLKYIQKPSDQPHSHKEIEQKFGLEVTFIFL